MKAVILLSGGLDSTTCLALAQSQGFDCHALSFFYEQRHQAELNAAKKIAKYFNAKQHHVINLASTIWQQASALTDPNIAVPTTKVSANEIPVTYVPARNTLFLAYALAYAESIDTNEIFIGVSQIDYSNYPDCRLEFIDAFSRMANLATKKGVEGHQIKIHTPLMHISKAETIQLGLSLGVDYSLTTSCYQGNTKGEACGICHSCQLRKKGFIDAGISDPTRYVI